MIYFFFAACVLAVLLVKFTPNNTPRAKMERLLARVSDFSSVLRVDDAYNATVLLMDLTSRRIAIGAPGKAVRLFSFDNLVGVEIERDGITIQKTNRGSQIVGAAVGGALLGPAGVLLGGLTGSKRQKSSVTRLALKLIVNDLQNPNISIVFLDTKAKVKMPLKQPVKTPPEERLAEWYGRFRIVLHEQQSGADGLYASRSLALPHAE